MDDPTDIIKNFEEILKQNANKQPLAIYKGQISTNLQSIQGQTSHSVQDVIAKVCTQIKAIQKADVPNTSRQIIKKLDNFKKSNFLPVNKLPRDVGVPNPPAMKFETQFVSDTQLLDVIDNAEAMVDNNGITQEFDNTFSQTDIENNANTVKNDIVCKENSTLLKNDTFIKNNNDIELINRDTDSSVVIGKEIKCSDPKKYVATIETIDELNFETQNNENKEFICSSNENYTEMLKECVEVERNLNVQDTEGMDDEEIQPSLVFEAKKSKTPSPLVFDLGSFENFEKIAVPIIEENSDLRLAKQLINSQIIGNELFIQTDIPHEGNQNKEKLSPILKMSAERLKITKTEYTSNVLKDYNTKGYISVEVKESDDTFLKDEILFSSDEENEYLHETFQDIPLTCALETSFYEQPDMLDKTMYVGFQTASNRPIQISTESFSKAKSILDKEKDLFSEVTLTDLVKSLSSKHNTSNTTNLTPSRINEGGIGVKLKLDETDNMLEKEIEHLKRPDKRKFEGFVTASRKKIKLSEIALARCKRVFHDINLDDNYDTENCAEIKSLTSCDLKDNINVDSCVNDSYKNKEKCCVATKCETNQLDDDILQEFGHDMSLLNDENTMSEDIKTTCTEIGKKFFDGIDFSDSIIANNAKDDIQSKQSSPQTNNNITEAKSNLNQEFIGFKMASNKQIKISSNALEKAKHVLQDIQICKEDVSELNNADTKELYQPSTSKDSGGFKTASKDIKVFSETLVRSINQNNITNVCENKPLNVSTNSKQTVGFKTANNNEIKISHDAYLKTKDLFKDIQVETDPENINEVEEMSKNQPDIDLEQVKDFDDDLNEVFNSELMDIEKEHVMTDFSGFKTASNKPVNFSEKASAYSKNVFKDLEDDLRCDNKENIELVPKMFKKSKTSVDMITSLSGKVSMENKSLETISKSFLTANAATSKEINRNLQDTNENIKFNYTGFQTARKKPIHISNEALAKSKEIFRDIDDENVETNLIKNNYNEIEEAPQFKGFQTANNKPIKVSAKALAQSKVIFKDIDDDDHLNIKNNNTTKTFKGFQTASNKPVQISAYALAKSKDIFKDFNGDVDTNNMENDDLKNFVGFQTASKKPVEISADALAKSKGLLDDIHHEKGSVVKSDNIKNKGNYSSFKGFQTASNKAVNISSEALARSKAIFQDIDKEFYYTKNIITNKDNTPNCRGFQIGSKKHVPVNNFEEHAFKTPDSAFEFRGFQTASKKPVQISAEALEKSKMLFKDIEEEIIVKNDGITKKHDIHKFVGIQTASNKPIQISQEALPRSKALFRDIDQLDIVENETNKDIPKFRGFETASKKPVQISEQALAKSKALFKEFDNEFVADKDLTKSSGFLGFQTANNSLVKVSEEALARSKRIFDDIDGFEENNATDIKITPLKGFQTANKNKVMISEEALKRSRRIFQNISKDDCKENLKDTVNIKQQQFKTHVGFKTGNNDIEVSESAFRGSRKLLTDSLKPKNVSEKVNTQVKGENTEKLLDTQVLINFEHTLYSEDFEKVSPKQSKRSGSPILSCPRPKRKKFNTPYQKDRKIPITDAIIIPKHDDILIFNEDYKKTKRYTLKDLAKVENANKKLMPDPYILNFNMDNLLNFEFTGQRNEITDGKFTIEGLKEYFLSKVNKKLVPNGWLDIHLKLILWKLISYEIKFTQTLNRVCTAKNVIEQLKYRYDKELYNVERSVLRKILEKDDVASKTMVLCVAGIFVDGVNVSSVTNISSNVELLLTDGWYCVKAVIDKMLTKLVYDEKLTVGCKIVTNGAELLNCDQGVAPWEDTSSLRLKIFGNSTRRARWDARLGCHGNAAILTNLSSVKPEGGKVSKLRLYVTRVYPMLYVEKFEDGSTVTRSERLENIHQIKYEADRQTAMEKLYEEVEKELSDQESQDSVGSHLKNRNHSESMMTESQTKSLEEKSNRQREKLLQNVQERVRKKIEEQGLNVGRNVVTLLKIRVAGIEENGSGVVVTKGFMSIWKPNDMLAEIIKEDSWIEVMNVVPTAIRYSEIHLSAGRQSIFIQSKFKENDNIKPHLKALARKCYPVGDLSQNPTMTTDYNEIDTVGFIFQIDEESSKQPFQNIYLSDGERNIICVNFWGGLKKFGFQNVLDTGQIISCTNLQKRAGNARKSIPQFRVTEFTFFTKTPKSLIARNIIVVIEKKLSGLDKKKYCADCIKLKNNYSNKCFTENVSPYRFNEVNLTKNKVFIDSPLVPKDNLNLTGLDFESTFRQKDTQELSPKSKERKKKVNQKIARLKMIGEPPPLSPMNIINKSKNAFNSYKSPLAQTSVANAKKSSDDSRNNIQLSPIISMNRTYVKNVNPVKLNFSNLQENSLDEVDHFAEEFDGSPPLSLE